MRMYSLLGRGCGNPQMDSNAIVDYQGKLHFPENQTLSVQCDESYIFNDNVKSKYITCMFVNEVLQWKGIEAIQCEKARCPPVEYLKVYNALKNDAYFAGENITYTCPNGIVRQAKCDWDSDTKSASWTINGNCEGMISMTLLNSII